MPGLLIGVLGGLLLIGIIVFVTLLSLECSFGDDDISMAIIYTRDDNSTDMSNVTNFETKEIVNEVNKSLDGDTQNNKDDISRISKEYEEFLTNLRGNKL